MESYLGYPLFLWQGLTNLLSLLIAGLVIAFVTTFYLKRKDESTRVAGVILEKRVEAQNEILNVLENSSQKLEMTQPSAGAIKEILLKEKINFKKELEILLPVSHHLLLNNFKETLLKEIEKQEVE